MRIVRCLAAGRESWGMVDPAGETVRLIFGPFSEWAPALCASPGTPPPLSGVEHPLGAVRLLPPLPETAMVVGVGATYRKHVAQLGLQMPPRPGTFLKTQASLIAAGEEIRFPAITQALDYEGELVVVVGDRLDPDDPARSVLGYTAGNDISARDQQFSGGVTGMDMFSAKALDATTGLGPWIVTRDEFGDTHPDLELTTTVNGEVRQHDRTGSMVWTVAELLRFIDARASFRSGDVLFTGTCAGVAHEDGRYLEPGDVVEVSVEKIGVLRNVVGPLPARSVTGSAPVDHLQ